MIKETLVYNIPARNIDYNDLPPMGYYFIAQEYMCEMYYTVNYWDYNKNIIQICEIPKDWNMALVIAKALNNPSCVEGL